MEIGQKKVRKDGKAVDIWGEYGKYFTNGHKSFTASEVKAVNELQNHEDRYRSNFAKLKFIMTKPKNCMAGDLTPRTANGKSDSTSLSNLSSGLKSLFFSSC